MQLKFHLCRPKILVWLSALTSYHNGDYVSLCWPSTMVVFSDIKAFQKYVFEDICFITFNKRKESSLSFCFAVKDSLAWIMENLKMTDRVWNRPIMHCNPLSIEYVKYGYRLCLQECMNSFVDIISGQKSPRIFFLYRFFLHCVLFWIEFILDLYHLVAKWLLKNFF